MKKNILLFLMIILITSGCSNKKLVCKRNMNNSSFEYSMEFKDDSIKTMNLYYDMDLTSYSNRQISMVEKQDFCSKLKDNMKSFKDAFNNCKQEIIDEHLRVTANIDVSKISKTTLEKISTSDKTKSLMEKQNYKCSVK